MNATTSTLQWATLKFDPTEPRTSNPDWQPQHSALVVFSDNQEHRIYFNPGVLSQLQQGDTVLCEYRRGKWRMARSQPPELMEMLNQRTPAPQTANAPILPPVAAPATPVQTTQPTSRDVIEIVGIFQELRAALPDAQETTIRVFSSTLFMQRRKEDAEF